MGNAIFHKGNIPSLINEIAKNAVGTVPWKRDINLSTGFSSENVTHELGHVFENNFAGGILPATVFGGGPADVMVSFVNGNPSGCLLIRWECTNINTYNEYVTIIGGNYTWPTNEYANHSVADDFAYTFEHTIYGSKFSSDVALGRLVWMEVFLGLTASYLP